MPLNWGPEARRSARTVRVAATTISCSTAWMRTVTAPISPRLLLSAERGSRSRLRIRFRSSRSRLRSTTRSNGRGAGANVNVETRSGTADVHGNVYYFGRNEALDANNFFANETG